ncbi:MAG: alpha-amylase [Clostridiales bacterium]|nr:alpha-amylase [Clostridiales bacterium]
MRRYAIDKNDRTCYPMGLTKVDGGIHVTLAAEAKECRLLLFEGKTGSRKDTAKPSASIAFPDENRTGNVWEMTLRGEDLEKYEYAFEIDGRRRPDPYGHVFHGRDQWGKAERGDALLTTPVAREEFDWQGDVSPRIPYENSIVYRAHVRGLTRHASSGVENKGTFRGVEEKIPYLRELGITTLELMPVTEFNEIMMTRRLSGGSTGISHYTTAVLSAAERIASSPVRETPAEKHTQLEEAVKALKKSGAKDSETVVPTPVTSVPSVPCAPRWIEEATGRLNYWGYVSSCMFAPKASYAGKAGSPDTELKSLIRALHKAGMELVLELFFTGEEAPVFALDVVRYWVREYHVDGIHIVGYAPIDLIAADPYLADTKLWAESWEGAEPKREKGAPRRLAEYNELFETDMRRVLKGDENQMNRLILQARRNPEGHGVINYLTNTNGFTLADLVSYDHKHNEANGEENRDGTDFNHSWNCGVEGPSRRKKVLEMRGRQLRNAFLLLLLSQGTPLILAGDEFGNSQGGNNNAWCQDNETSWLNWNQLKSNHALWEFVQEAIAFRRAHPVFHMAQEPRLADSQACGYPDVSYHGRHAWKPELEAFRRQIAVMYCGKYGTREDGTTDDYFYVAYNMHWEPHTFGIPNLPRDRKWRIRFDTHNVERNGYYPDGEEEEIPAGKEFLVPPRTIVVLVGK